MARSFRQSLGRELERVAGTRPDWGFELCVWLLHPGVVLDDLVKKVRCVVLASGTLAPFEPPGGNRTSRYLRGAVSLCGAGVLLNISSKFWRNLGYPDAAVGSRAG